MKAQIVSLQKLDKLRDGTPCHITRINTTCITNEDNSRKYVTVTSRAIYETIEEMQFNATGEVIMKADGVTPKTITKKVLTIKERKDEPSTETLRPEKIKELFAMLKSSIPKNANDIERDLFLRSQALLYMTINHDEFPNGYLGTKKWNVV